MDSRTRDPLLAAAVAAGLLAVARALGVEADDFLDPRAALVGVCGALVLELPFLLFPRRAHRLWYRPVVQVGGAALVLVVGSFLFLLTPWVVTALLAGLLTYFALYALTSVGVLPAVDPARDT